MPPKETYSVLVARFPHGRSEDPDTTDWLISTVIKMHQDERISDIFRWRADDTPITMTRNDCLAKAQEAGVDFLLMVDSDMSPDCALADNRVTDLALPWAKPFWETSLEFAIEQRKAGTPCIIGAPYLGPSPVNNVYVFHWATSNNNPIDTHPTMALCQYNREHAADMRGIQEVGALPTGVILMDMRAVGRFMEIYDPPYFYYEFDDKFETKKASTEDVTITRDMSLLGIKQYCNWDAWAGHWKRELVLGPPALLTPQMLSDRFKRAVIREHEENNTFLAEADHGRIERISEPAGRNGSGQLAAAAGPVERTR